MRNIDQVGHYCLQVQTDNVFSSGYTHTAILLMSSKRRQHLQNAMM